MTLWLARTSLGLSSMYPAGSPSSTRSARCWVKTNPLTQPLSVAVTLLENLTFLTFPSS